MPTATPDVRIDWRGDGLSAITNEAFLVDTTGWSVSASINAAATSLTRTTGDGVLGGVTTNTCAELVTTSTSGSGCVYDFGSHPAAFFITGRTYRFSVWLKRMSGTTAGRILIGSLGTAGDRASATFTLTDAWARYTVDWTPTGDRIDIEAIVTNNAASVGTFRICLAEVFEAIDDIGAYGADEVDELSLGRGLNFDGSSAAPGQARLRVVNDAAQKYSPDNASSSLFGLIGTDRTVYARAVYGGLVYGLFAGTIRRLVPMPRIMRAEIMAEDPLFGYDRREVSVIVSTTRSVRDFRGAILDAMNESALRRSLAYGPESDIVTTWTDQRSALGLLTELNLATGSVHYIRAHPVPSVRYVYTTIDRVALASGTSAEHFDDTAIPSYITDLTGYEVTDEARITSQRVTPTPRRVLAVAETVWVADSVPFTVPAGTTRTIWAHFDPVAAMTASYTATNTPTVVLTAFGDSAKIAITAGASASTVSGLAVSGKPIVPVAYESVLVTTGTGEYTGSDIESEWLGTVATAQGLAESIVYRYGTDKPRLTLEVTNRTDSHLAREVGETVTLTFGRLSLAAKRFLVAAIRTEVQAQARLWVTSLELEVAPTSQLWFTLDTAGRGLDDAGGGTEGVLAY